MTLRTISDEPLRSLLDDPSDLERRDRRIRRRLSQHGAHLEVGGTPAQHWALDAVPAVVDSGLWDRIGAAGAQRARLLEMVLADLYGPRRLLSIGLIPAEAVLVDPGYLRSWIGSNAPCGLVTAAVDVTSGPTGLRVLADRTEAPSGAGFALENRGVMAATVPEAMHATPPAHLEPWFATLRAALAQAAPAGIDDPRVVILTPGAASTTSYEHSFLARTMGFTLVEPADLTVRDGAVWLKSVSGPEPVHVILRRVDSAWCDPLELRADSVLGVAGLVEAARRGNVTVVNPLGSGVLENQAVFAVLGSVCSALLSEELLIEPVPTWWCGDPIGRSHVLANLDRMVVKPVFRGAGRQSRFGRLLSRGALEELSGRIAARPHLYVGQEELDLDTLPSFADGHVVDRPAVMRAFLALDGTDYAWMQGGLTRVADRTEHITMSSGGISKDTWVVGARPRSVQPPVAALPQVDLRSSLTSRAGETMFWIGRNLERAETVIRFAGAVEQRIVRWPELRHEAGGTWWLTMAATLAALTGTDDVPSDGDPLARALCDPAAPRSVVTSLHFLLGGARTVRELFSLDTWRILDEVTAGHLRLVTAESPAVADAASALLSPLNAFAGLLSESMVRDPGWRFLDLGRRIERGLLGIRTLAAALGREPEPSVAPTVYEAVLSGWDSLVAYRRRHRSDVEPSELVALLVSDTSNPRSVAFQVERVAENLLALPGRAPLHHLDPVTVTGTPWTVGPELAAIADRLVALARSLELHYFAQVHTEAVSR